MTEIYTKYNWNVRRYFVLDDCFYNIFGHFAAFIKSAEYDPSYRVSTADLQERPDDHPAHVLDDPFGIVFDCHNIRGGGSS